MLDGTGTADEYAGRAAELGQPALALTDHGTLAGALHHLDACERHNIFGIVGVEAYYKPTRQPHDETNKVYYHMVLLAKSLAGWHSLLRLTSESHRDDAYYYRPIVDSEMLLRHHDGLVASTACMASFVSKSLLREDEEAIERHMKFMKDTFREDFYMEIMPNTIPEQATLNPLIANIAMQHSVPLVATTDAHYVCHDFAPTHKILMEHIYEHDDDTLFLMSEEEVKGAFATNQPEFPADVVDEAVANTNLILAGFDPYTINRGPKYPRVKGGPGAAEKIVREWAEEGLKRLADNGWIYTDVESYRERMEYELGVFTKLDVMDYVQIVAKIVRAAKEHGILVGPGRGSAAGSLVCYLTRITSVDPIAHDLLFERFLNPDRKAMPDIDIDFSSTGREWVKQFIRDEYGEDHVADVVAYQTYGAKSAIQTVARSLGINMTEVMAATKDLENFYADEEEANEGHAIDAHLRTNKKLQGLHEKYPEVFEHARRIEGQTKNVSLHASAVVLTDRPVNEYMPTIRSKSGAITTAWSDSSDFPIISKFGFLKIDVLGLLALTRREHAVRLIKERHGVDINLDEIPVARDPDMGEAEVLTEFKTGGVLGVFQFDNSAGMRSLLSEMKVDHFNDLTAAVALYRPGPMANIPTFVARKTGKKAISYRDDRLKPILEETYAIYVYQEQALKISQLIAGFTPGQADDLRKAIGKKDAKLMASLEKPFLEGAKKTGTTDKVARQLWAENKASADYSFAKAHAACYAVGAYQDMWLKHHYPIEFFTALMSNLPKPKKSKSGETVDKLPSVLREAKARGIEILTPDINISGRWFTIDGDAIRFGLAAVKQCGDVAVEEILAHQPYFSYEDFDANTTRKRCNKKVKDALVHAGAFDSLGMRADWSVEDRSRTEQESMGYSLSADFSKYIEIIRERGHDPEFVSDAEEDQYVMVGGEVVSTRIITTKTGKQMAFADIAFEASQYSLTFFTNVFNQYASLIEEGKWIFIGGAKNDRGSITVKQACEVTDFLDGEGNAS